MEYCTRGEITNTLSSPWMRSHRSAVRILPNGGEDVVSKVVLWNGIWSWLWQKMNDGYALHAHHLHQCDVLRGIYTYFCCLCVFGGKLSEKRMQKGKWQHEVKISQAWPKWQPQELPSSFKWINMSKCYHVLSKTPSEPSTRIQNKSK